MAQRDRTAPYIDTRNHLARPPRAVPAPLEASPSEEWAQVVQTNVAACACIRQDMRELTAAVRHIKFDASAAARLEHRKTTLRLGIETSLRAALARHSALAHAVQGNREAMASVPLRQLGQNLLFRSATEIQTTDRQWQVLSQRLAQRKQAMPDDEPNPFEEQVAAQRHPAPGMSQASSSSSAAQVAYASRYTEVDFRTVEEIARDTDAIYRMQLATHTTLDEHGDIVGDLVDSSVRSHGLVKHGVEELEIAETSSRGGCRCFGGLVGLLVLLAVIPVILLAVRHSSS
jgi:hypothetical protein